MSMPAHEAQPITVMAVYGTRPEAIKMAPLVLALREDERFRPVVVVTGQHGRMLEQVNEHFGVAPDFDLGIHRPGQTLTDITTRTLDRLARVFEQCTPDAVLVQGDTSTTFAAALAACYAGVPVVHTEAGLRTGDPLSPFPEEINRRLTTQLASLHLAPTAEAKRNLLRDQVDPDRVLVTGNSVIDALLMTVAGASGTHGEACVARYGAQRPFVLVTAHRRESWGDPLRRIGRALARLADAFPSHDFVFPVHGNPAVREAIEPAIAGRANVLLTEPLPYPRFCALLADCALVLTDSGGVQEEAPSLGKPVLVMRDTTERPEAVAAGVVELVGTDEQRVFDAVSRLLESPSDYERMARAMNPYGDGRAAERTVRAIAGFFGRADGAPLEQFDAGPSRVSPGDDPAGRA